LDSLFEQCLGLEGTAVAQIPEYSLLFSVEAVVD
jgi:hypothetical protein